MKKVRIMYHGERVNFLDKVYQLFKSKDGEAHSFSGIKRVYFGDVYEMIDNKLRVRPDGVEHSDWTATEEERREYEAQKLVVQATRQERRKAMKLARPKAEIVKAIELLRPYYIALPNTNRRRFMEWVANECSKKKGRR